LLGVVIGLSLLGDISQLASATVLLLLFVFTTVNIGLVVLILREGRIEGAFNVPILVPILAASICSILIVVRIAQNDMVAPMIAGGLLLAILALYFVTGRGRAERVEAFWAKEAETP